MERIATDSWELESAARGWLANTVDVETARTWVAGDLARARALASVASIGGAEISDVGAYLVEDFGDDDKVSSMLAGNFIAGFWVGHESDRITDQIAQVKSWIDDLGQSQAVKHWARNLLDGLEMHRRRAIQSEAEESW